MISCGLKALDLLPRSRRPISPPKGGEKEAWLTLTTVTYEPSLSEDTFPQAGQDGAYSPMGPKGLPSSPESISSDSSQAFIQALGSRIGFFFAICIQGTNTPEAINKTFCSPCGVSLQFDGDAEW